MKTTFSNGYLGSCDDEERSEMRYVMRNAELASHQVFERTWRFRLRGSMLVSVSIHPLTHCPLRSTLGKVAWSMSLQAAALCGPRLEACQSVMPPRRPGLPSGGPGRDAVHGVVLWGNPIQTPTTCGACNALGPLARAQTRSGPATPTFTFDLKSSKRTRWI